MGRVGDEGKVHLIPAEILSSPLVRLQCAQMAVKPKEHHCSPRGWAFPVEELVFDDALLPRGAPGEPDARL